MINVAAIRMQQFGVQFYQASLTASDIDKLVRFEVLNYGDTAQSGVRGNKAKPGVADASARIAKEAGVLGKDESHFEESFENGLLEYPQYTRPRSFEGRDIPAVLISGDHGRIAEWRAEQSRVLTKARRPDLLK